MQLRSRSRQQFKPCLSKRKPTHRVLYDCCNQQPRHFPSRGCARPIRKEQKANVQYVRTWPLCTTSTTAVARVTARQKTNRRGREGWGHEATIHFLRRVCRYMSGRERPYAQQCTRRRADGYGLYRPKKRLAEVMLPPTRQTDICSL